MVSIIDGNSQELKPPQNSLYFELFGSGGVYSINYERQVSSNFYGRFGMATFKEIDFLGESTTRISTFPVMIGYLTGTGKNHFEIAGGMLFGTKLDLTDLNNRNKILDLIVFVGYRYQPPVDGLVFRAGFTPFFSLDNDANYPDSGYFPSAGISIGYHF